VNQSRINRERSERVAAAAVANALNAKLIHRDVRGAQQTRDFDLVYRDGRSDEPLEVTTFASQLELQSWERLDRLERRGGIPAEGLRRVWHLDVGASITDNRTATLDVRRIEREVIRLLAALEAADYHRIEYGEMARDPDVAEASHELLVLGIDAGHSRLPSEGEIPRVVLVAPTGGFRHPDLVADGVEREAHKIDNQNKLKSLSNASRRHLVVIFDGSSGPAFVAVHLGTRGRLPALPPPITTAWALAGKSLLGTTPSNGWDQFDIPQRVFDSPDEWFVVL
jgi:hypothetical protein